MCLANYSSYNRDAKDPNSRSRRRINRRRNRSGEATAVGMRMTSNHFRSCIRWGFHLRPRKAKTREKTTGRSGNVGRILSTKRNICSDALNCNGAQVTLSVLSTSRLTLFPIELRNSQSRISVTGSKQDTTKAKLSSRRRASSVPTRLYISRICLGARCESRIRCRIPRPSSRERSQLSAYFPPFGRRSKQRLL